LLFLPAFALSLLDGATGYKISFNLAVSLSQSLISSSNAQCWYNNATCTVSGISGICANNTASCCPGGTLTSGLCPGTTSIQCCTSPTCNTPSGSGTCVQTAACTGTSYSGYCAGPTNIQCCVKGSPAAGNYGTDVSTAVSTTNFTCMKNSNYNWVVVRAYRSSDTVDTNACNNLNNARSVGITARDAYIFPCPKCSSTGSAQVAACVNNLKSCASTSWSAFLWLDIEDTSYWTTNTTTNRNFFESMVSGCNSAGIRCGVYTSQSQWTPIMGSYNGGSSMKLWYPRYQSPPQPNFNEFTPFGGWNTPFAKQYVGDTTLCGVGVDLNWTPNTPSPFEKELSIL